MKKNEEPLVFLGFGNKQPLTELIKLIGTPQEGFLLNLPFKTDQPPSYRRVALCSPEEISAYQTYAGWLQELLDTGQV